MDDQISAWQALLRLLATAWDPEGVPPPESIPWPDIACLAASSNVGALLHIVTRDMGDSIPPESRLALQNMYYHTAAANTLCMHQLAQVRAALSAVGTPVLLLKGAALVEALYENLAVRLIGDIDLAVPPQNVPACRSVLIELGYVPAAVEQRTGMYLAYHNEEAFLPPAPFQAPVELHWHLLDVPYYLRKVPMDWFWQNSEPYSVAGQPFQVLNLEACLVYLPAHLALHHQFHGLHSFLDLALLILHNRERIDWERVIATARDFELLTALRETLDRLAGLWPTLPSGVPHQKLHSVKPHPADERLFRLLTTDPRSPTLDFYSDLVCLPDLPARTRFVLLNLFPQPAYMVERYGIRARWHLPYWYLHRFGDGLVKFARTLRRARRLNQIRQ